ncbi:MAG: SDR family oxidoreductase [Deltaproteobacteria bacterium]|jgi:NAD(P)-dependent dehydrogenase (short-subunit alcohol dehydrogenase family)|nr:SDR family oxidoreductase [Deltaproteobacteria bacterium]
MYDDLKGKRVVVTGGASGIGLAVARRFVSENCKVVILDRNQEAIDTARAERPEFADGICADVSSQDEVKAAFEQIDQLMGGLDILISNAGISVRKPFTEVDYAQWSKIMRVNLDGMFFCARAAIQRMEPQRSGVILFTASTSGLAANPNYADYSASKAAIINLARTIAWECAPWLRINAVCPGYVMTPMQKAEYTAEMIDEVNSHIPMGRHANPEELAAVYAFLASSEASYITGTAIIADGGGIA